MSEDNQWRQLGSIVNTVLAETRTKAIRKGMAAKVPLRRPAPNARQDANGVPPGRLGHGFLSGGNPPAASPAQLELPFGITAAPETGLDIIRAPRGARLM